MKILKSVFHKFSDINTNCPKLYYGESGQVLLKTIIPLAVTTEFKCKINFNVIFICLLDEYLANSSLRAYLKSYYWEHTDIVLTFTYKP